MNNNIPSPMGIMVQSIYVQSVRTGSCPVRPAQALLQIALGQCALRAVALQGAGIGLGEIYLAQRLNMAIEIVSFPMEMW